MAIGQCLVIQPTALGLTVATGSGVFMSCLVLRTRGSRPLGVFVPLVLAAIIATFSFETARHGLIGPASGPLAASLVTFPPGTALTVAAVELTSDGLVANASCIALLTVQLLLFAMGTVTDAELAGLPAQPSVSGTPADILGSGTTWLGAAVFVLASAVCFRWPAWAQRRALRQARSAWDDSGAGSSQYDAIDVVE